MGTFNFSESLAKIEPLQLNEENFFRNKIKPLLQATSKRCGIEIKTMPQKLSEVYTSDTSKVPIKVCLEARQTVFDVVCEEKNRYAEGWKELALELEKHHEKIGKALYSAAQSILNNCHRDASFYTNLPMDLKEFSKILKEIKKCPWAVNAVNYLTEHINSLKDADSISFVSMV